VDRLSPLAEANANFRFAAELFAGLVAGGVADVVVCPGSRSAPLAATAATTPGLRCFPLLDERGAGFFGLGLARARRRPVVLVCTSGTAAANFLPAVAEAFLARVPLLVLSADRPPELRDRGAPQTILQAGLFGGHVRWAAEAACPEEVDAAVQGRALATRALREATAELAGPVHLNLPFREPLDPSVADSAPVPRGTRVRSTGATRLRGGADTRGPAAALAAALAGALRPLIVIGPSDGDESDAQAIASLARRCGAPLLAEPLSGLRFGPHVGATPVVGAADHLLRGAAAAGALQPDRVVRIGAAPTSKILGRHLDDSDAELWIVDPNGAARDPAGRADHLLEAPAGLVAEAAAAELGTRPASRCAGWLSAWCDAEKRAWQQVESVLEASPAPGVPHAIRAAFAALPEGAALVLANSLAVRDAESFLPPESRAVAVFGNRGANGIDGTLSTALGVAAAGRRTLLVTGDLALLHDVGALFAGARLGLALDVLVVNDGGGGIFDRLPIAGYGDAVRFDDVFRLAHDADLCAIARGFGADAARVQSPDDIAHRLSGPPTCVRVSELRVSAASNAALHRDVFAAVGLGA
jgi:2-succinyl-5-enolpyruvyl-6-hydroxy-3-cyclohexene-1-carboxylate synthase